jgi:hypothetical protein
MICPPLIYKQLRLFYPPSQKTESVNSRINAKSFLLRRDFAPDEAVRRRYPDRKVGELHNPPLVPSASGIYSVVNYIITNL